MSWAQLRHEQICILEQKVKVMVIKFHFQNAKKRKFLPTRKNSLLDSGVWAWPRPAVIPKKVIKTGKWQDYLQDQEK